MITTSLMGGVSRRARLAQAVVFSVGLFASSCVTSPHSNTDVTDGGASVTFDGVVQHRAGLQVVVLVLTAPGRYITLGSGSVGTDNHFSVSVRVPSQAWQGDCGTAHFRLQTNHGEALSGQDAHCLASLPASPTLDQQIACATPEVVLTRGVTHTGDIAIVGQEQADLYRCVRILNGNLTIDSSISPTVSLPLLAQVNGDMSVVLQHQYIFPAADLQHPVVQSGVLDTPLLATVTGNLLLTNHKVGGVFSDYGIYMAYGLPSLTELGGNLTIRGTFFQSHFVGANALTHINGDLTVDWGVGDLDEANLLTSLTSVAGNVSLSLAPNSRTLLDALSTVGGSFSVAGANNSYTGGTDSLVTIGGHMASALQTVGGSLTLRDVDNSCGGALFTHLTSIGGTLELTSLSPAATLGATGASHLTAGGLNIHDTELSNVPLASDFALSPTATVNFSANSGLCQCQVDAFGAALASTGWTGAVTSSGDGTTATCTPTCPSGCL